MNVLRSIPIFIACAVLGGCGGVYLHDERLVSHAASVDANLTAAQPLAPFDDQLSKLQAFAREEDLAVARFWTAQRDGQLATVLSTEQPEATFAPLATTRLDALAPNLGSAGASALQAAFDGRDDLLAKKALAEVEVARQTLRWKAAYPEDKRKVDCPSLTEEVTRDEAQSQQEAAGAANDPNGQLLPRLIRRCWDLKEFEAVLTASDAIFLNVQGEIGGAQAVAVAAEARTSAELSDRVQAINDAITKAKTDAGTSSVEGLNALRTSLQTALSGLGAAARLAGWEQASAEIDKYLLCLVEKAGDDAAAQKEACEKAGPTTTTGRNVASWAFFEAVAQLSDAQTTDGRSAQWGLAAKAIVKAEETAARLDLEQATRLAAAERDRVHALVTEAVALSDALGTPDRTVVSCIGAGCAFAAYADSWNQGRIPAQILRFRSVQLEREYAVRRARAVAEKQRVLALAGAATLKAYAEGGLKPETIAQLFFNLTLLGVEAD